MGYYVSCCLSFSWLVLILKIDIICNPHISFIILNMQRSYNGGTIFLQMHFPMPHWLRRLGGKPAEALCMGFCGGFGTGRRTEVESSAKVDSPKQKIEKLLS
jgi:hypothetical protein